MLIAREQTLTKQLRAQYMFDLSQTAEIALPVSRRRGLEVGGAARGLLWS